MPARKRSTKPAKGAGDTSKSNSQLSGSGDAHVKKASSVLPQQRSATGKMKHLFGFNASDLQSWDAFTKLLNSPRDPASMAAWRILFGLLMMVDIPQERGMAYADRRWGDPSECRFPLFIGLAPLPVDWMYVVYLTMLAGAVGIFLGAFYRLSCLLFCVPYWYLFFLDKTAWNNHSYLYGLIGFQLLFMDAHNLWSIDSWWNSRIRNRHVPLWNIAVIRFQIFVVYFLAGLKKLDADWVGGYSMEFLSRHWVFEPFRLLLTDGQIDHIIVHMGGLLLDLSTGFLLFFDATRPAGTFLCSSFHIMNSQLFSIGMFPYAMLASTSVFYADSWPRMLATVLPGSLKNCIPCLDQTPQPSDQCVYSSTKDSSKKTDAANKKGRGSGPRLRHHLAVGGFLLYVSVQLFLPYSHFITKGYNNWTNGLYGYSWDMMVHTWHTQHIKIKYVDGVTGKEGYLAPGYWTESNRWASHGDMTKQYATCIAAHLQQMEIREPQLYVDVWKSMNGRFQQRMFDPTVDLVKADWSPFMAMPWLMPLLTELSDWRTKLNEIEDQLADELDVTFVADFPGMYLENFVSEDLGNTTIQVLSGQIEVEMVEKKRNVTLGLGDRIQLPHGAFHNVHTISTTPSCYMYVFVNTTEQALMTEVNKFMSSHEAQLRDMADHTPESIYENLFKGSNVSDAVMNRVLERMSAAAKMEEKMSMTVAEKAQRFVEKKAGLLHRTFIKTVQALNHILSGGESVAVMMGEDEEEAPDARLGQQDRGEL